MQQRLVISENTTKANLQTIIVYSVFFSAGVGQIQQTKLLGWDHRNHISNFIWVISVRSLCHFPRQQQSPVTDSLQMFLSLKPLFQIVTHLSKYLCLPLYPPHKWPYPIPEEKDLPGKQVRGWNTPSHLSHLTVAVSQTFLFILNLWGRNNRMHFLAYSHLTPNVSLGTTIYSYKTLDLIRNNCQTVWPKFREDLGGLWRDMVSFGTLTRNSISVGLESKPHILQLLIWLYSL